MSSRDPYGWDDFDFPASPGSVAGAGDGWEDFESYLHPGPATTPQAARGGMPTEPEGPGFLSRARTALSSLNPAPVVRRMAEGLAAGGRVFGPGMEEMAMAEVRGNPVRPQPVNPEDILPAANAAAAMLFPGATAIETIGGGIIGALSGQSDGAVAGYEEGVFGPLSRATGLDKAIEGIENPILRAGAAGAGAIASGGAVEYGARRGMREVMDRAADIGKEVAEGLKGLDLGGMPQAAMNPYEGSAAMPPEMTRRLSRPALPPGPAPREADPFVAGADGVRAPHSRQRLLPAEVRDPSGVRIPDQTMRGGQNAILAPPASDDLDFLFGRATGDYFEGVGAPPAGRTDYRGGPVQTPEQIGATFDAPSNRSITFGDALSAARALTDDDLLTAYKERLRVATRTGADEATRGGSYFRANARSADARLDAYEQAIQARGLEKPSLTDAWRDVPEKEAAERFTVGSALEKANTLGDDQLLDELDRAKAAMGGSPDRTAVERFYTLAGRAKDRGLIGGSMFGDEYGGVSAQALPGLVGATGGGLTGETPEERVQNALVGGAAGLGVGAVLRSASKAGTPGGGAPEYLSDPDVASVLSKVSTGDRPPRALRSRVREVGENLYTRLVDDLHPLKQFGRKVGGDERLAEEASRASGWQAAAELRLQNGFRAVVERSKGNEQGAVALANAQRALELADNGFTQKGIDLDQARRVVERLGQIPEVSDAANALRGYYRELLDYRLENGVITKEDYDRIVEKGALYVPLVRDLENAAAPSAGGGRLVNRGTGVRKMSDSEVKDLPSIDPYQQAILDTFEAEQTVAKQRVSNVVAAIVEQDPEAASEFVVKVANPEKARGGKYVEANIGGKREAYKVLDPELYNAWASFDPQTQGLVSKILRPFKKMLQVGVTTLPDFAVANAIRDNAVAGIQYSGIAKQSAAGSAIGAVAGAAADEDDRLGGALRGAAFGAGAGPLTANLARTLGAMRDVIRNDDIYQEWVKEGGAGFGFYVRDQKSAKKALEQLRSDGVDLGDVINPKSWWHAFQAINHAVEQAPRLARYKALREAGEEIPAAVASSRDISLDFRRIGKDMKGVAEANAFFNAQVQGWDKIARMMKSKRTWAAGATMLTAPSVALWSVNKDNPEYWSRPAWEKNIFWLVPKGGEAGGFWRIPKPFEVGFVFASIPERLLDYAYQKDPEALKHGLGDMASTYGVSSLLPLTTAATPIIENIANYDMFTNRPIVSRAEERLPAELQHDERTSSLAVGAGKLTGASPKKIDHLIRGWTGSAGQVALDATSSLARKAGLDDRPEPVAGRAPLVGRFSTRPDQTSDAETLLYERYAAGERARNGVREVAKSGDEAKIRAYIQDHADELRDYYGLRQQAEGLEKIRAARRQVRESELSSDEKERAMTKLAALAAQIAAHREQEGVHVAQR